jgi:hypothetical protein
MHLGGLGAEVILARQDDAWTRGRRGHFAAALCPIICSDSGAGVRLAALEEAVLPF